MRARKWGGPVSEQVGCGMVALTVDSHTRAAIRRAFNACSSSLFPPAYVTQTTTCASNRRPLPLRLQRGRCTLYPRRLINPPTLACPTTAPYRPPSYETRSSSSPAMTSTSTPRSRSRSSTSGDSSDTTMNSPPLTPVRPRHSSHGHAAASQQTSPTDPAFSLLALPRELRNHIYMFALISPFPFWYPAPSSPKHNVALSLLRTNRQVHDEAAPILYAQNKFLFVHPSDCNIFRVNSSPFSENITSVYLRIREKDVKLWTKYLGSKQSERSMQADLPKLKSLWIFLRCGTMGTPGMIGQLGAGGGGNLPVGLVAQVQAMQHAIGGQMTALQQQVQNQIQVLQQQVHMAMGQANVFANPPVAAPPAPIPFAQFAQAAQAPQLPQAPFPLPHPHGQVNNPPPNPSPLAQHLAANVATITQGQPAQPPAHQLQHQQPPQPHPLFGSFLRFEREMGLESLCLSLRESRPVEADIKIVCIVKLPKLELQRLLRVYADELSADRNGDARTKFTRRHGVDVSLEISGYEVGG